jgi:hypothetical protein
MHIAAFILALCGWNGLSKFRKKRPYFSLGINSRDFGSVPFYADAASMLVFIVLQAWQKKFGKEYTTMKVIVGRGLLPMCRRWAFVRFDSNLRLARPESMGSMVRVNNGL